MRSKHGRWLAGALGMGVLVCAVGIAAVGAQAQGPPLWAGPAGGIVPVRDGAHGAGGGAGGAGPLVYHNGMVMTTATTVTPIYWGTGWSSPGDKQTGMKAFYGGVGGSGYMNTNTEYTDTSQQHVSSAVTYSSPNGAASQYVTSGNYVVVPDTTSSKAPSTGDVLAVVAKAFPNPTANGYYPVYSDEPRGTAGYCAWHSAGSINGTPVTFAFFFNLDGDSGCSVGSANSYSPGTQALANVSGHELSEMVTDTQLNAWYDKRGNENADKCAWKFLSPVNLGGTSWNVQMNWSNAANGCIQTK